ncbi:mechanosensitive ion channel domain-containing protein [uncultured Thiodictyon sp.]|uniref:mechanosensitive ion channel domain-containing protein n=1 Tax=uncultured Thiodictyon sp. TaxID=1846217 RepID=UPI0025D06A3F|nr:mechanosensitive ion channel domain-containing protein [uncultured Thiodictyon sp.]
MTQQFEPYPAYRPQRVGLPGLLLLTLLTLSAVGLAFGPSAPLSAAPAAPAVPPPGATLPGTPTAAEIASRIKETESAKGLDEPARAALLEAYRAAASYLESAQTFTAKAGEYARALEEAPNQAADLREQLGVGGAAAKAAAPALSPAQLAALDGDELSARLIKTRTELTAAEARTAELDKTIDGTSARTSEARGRIADLRQAIDQLDAAARLVATPTEATATTQANAWVRSTHRLALTAESRALEQELASQGVRDELYRVQREQLALGLRQLKERQTQLQALEDQRRKSEAEQARRESEAAQRAAVNKHALVQQAAKDNAELTATLGELAGQLDQFNALLAQTERERKRIAGDFRGARERIEVAGVNQALGLVLDDRRRELPDLRKLRREIAARNDKIADASLRQIHYREEQRKLRDLDAALSELTARDPAAQGDEVRDELRDLLEQRRSLIDKALLGIDAYIRKQVELNDAAEGLIQTATDYDDFLAQHLLWVRTAGPLSPGALSTLPEALAWVLSKAGWSEVVQVLRYELLRSPVSWVGLLVVIVLSWKQAAIKRAILATAEPLRRVRTDRFSYTLEAIGLTALAALPLSLACLVVGRELAVSIEATDFTRTLGTALTKVSLGLYFLRAFRTTCIPGGVADRHFRWEGQVLVQIRTNLRWYTPYVVLTALVAYSAYRGQEAGHIEVLGRLASIAAMFGTAAFLGLLLHPRTGVLATMLADQPRGWANRLRNLWYPTIVGVPLALAVLAMLGYIYTAGTLFASLVEAAWLALGLVLVQQVIVRWLVYARRRLALQAALERQAARRAQANAADDEVDPAPPVDEPEADLANLDERTRKLLHASIFMLAILGLWLIWSPMLPALTIFKKLTLWHYSTLVDGTAALAPVTAADVGLVLIILSVGVVAAKNLPALIEILLLQNSSVNAGTRYAVRTLAGYAITAFVLLLAFGALGLRWSQVQWLVAALSVGIGFGLQEIVANFISGLIILFERPVRVGDVVTIGTTTGTVTKIEIRATTIRNWDRQELIVPNKEFITGRLLNWTLTDQLNRIVITVGIEYGSDARLALTLLTEAAAAHPRVLAEPPPLATLDAFGDNALTLVLRCYLETMDARQGVLTDMHLAIEQSFREHGIGIAFPQRDINISAREPIDVRLHRVGRADSDPDAPDPAPDRP